MSRIIIVLTVAVIVISCSVTAEQNLMGNWKYVSDSTRTSAYDARHSNQFTFLNDSLVDTRVPYFRETNTNGVQRREFIGTVTRYRKDRDSLYILEPYDSAYRGLFIVSLTDSSFILRTEQGDRKYRRFEYNPGNDPVADRIALSTSGCFGRCPIMNIIIGSNGDLFYCGERFVDKTGYYRAKITKEQFDAIEREFRKVDLAKLKGEYRVNHTDDETVTTTLVKNKSIVRSVYDYGEVGPDELVWAYPRLRYFWEDVELKAVDSTQSNLYHPFTSALFELADQECALIKSESFLLSVYLNEAPRVAPVDASRLIYELKSWGMRWGMLEPAIRTDGRYYQVTYKDRPSYTIDIGFNFLEVNSKVKAFKKIER